ncbi:bacillithiol biosynthesis cysteine-adding enzyme BshC [Niabella insulamsoli]|uniref:bacillithiol biosynthesis cysteine-adding enzyme BshC n=1 Tax=Niabella insulamsoli TaxID=3144874 RepID=UPI0031FE2B00
MNFQATGIPYDQTHSFSKTVLDYLHGSEALRPFYHLFPEKSAMLEAIKQKAEHKQDRELLYNYLKDQYDRLEQDQAVISNIELLRETQTFTITTAHQPNIFTGPLYFIYKILHAAKLAAYCRAAFPAYNFVPVYYMGSEDADLDELGHIYLKDEKLVWNTDQKGAVGRMKIDDALLKLIKRIESEIGVLPHGAEIMEAVKSFYKKGSLIQDATLGFVNFLFGKYGVVVVVPDAAPLKSVAIDLFKDELLNQRSSALVADTAEQLLDKGYKTQAHGRDINLFYLTEKGERLRIEKQDDRWQVVDSDISFTESELMRETASHPERFSPNVILRGLFQEMILPNIAFIGGGGELAYWLELKAIFDQYKVPYPMLVLRNSVLVVAKKPAALAKKLDFEMADLFKSPLHLKRVWVQRHSENDVSTAKALGAVQNIYRELSEQAEPIDTTLKGHIYALQKQHEKNLVTLGKKLLRAEKRNHEAAMRQIDRLKQQLFPLQNLQERIENILVYYATWGPDFMDTLYQHAHAIKPEFLILEEV